MVSAAFPNRPFNLRDNVWFIGNEVNNNRSLVGFELWIDKVSYSPTFSGATAARWMRLNGGYVHEFYGNGFDFRNGSNFLLANGTAWINHNADGTGSVLIEAAATFDILGSTSLSITIGLPTIPRASTASFVGGSSFEPGTVQTINTNRASGSFTHDLWYTFGPASTDVPIATNVGSSTTWTPPMSLLNNMPNWASAGGYIATRTYNNGVALGTTTTPFTLNAPASVVPTWSSVTVSDSVPGVASAVGRYVQGVSKPQFTIVGAAAPYSATVPTQKFEVEGQTVQGASGVVPLPLTGSGTVPATHTIVDSRGRTKSQVTNLSVLPYVKPTVISWSFKRSLADGTLDPDDGTSLRFTVNATASSLLNTTERNSLQIKVFTRVRGTSTWTLSHTQPVTGLTYNSWFVVTGPFSLTLSYDVRLEAIDLFSTSAVSSTAATGAVFMHWSATGVGIGKYHQQGALDIQGAGYASTAWLDAGSGISNWNSIVWNGRYYSLAGSASNVPAIPNASTYNWVGEHRINVHGGVGYTAHRHIQEIWPEPANNGVATTAEAAYVRDRSRGAVHYTRWRDTNGTWSQWERNDPNMRMATSASNITWNYLEGRHDLNVGTKDWIIDGVFSADFVKYRVDYFYYTADANGSQLGFRIGGATNATTNYNYQNLYITGTGTPAGAVTSNATGFGVAAQSANGHHGYFEIGNPMQVVGNSQKTVSGVDNLVGGSAGVCQWGGWLNGHDSSLVTGFRFALSNNTLNGVATGGWIRVTAIG